jgi:hypothetical protein
MSGYKVNTNMKTTFKMVTYDISIKRGNRYITKTKTFYDELHFSRWYAIVNASGDKIIDTFKKS